MAAEVEAAKDIAEEKAVVPLPPSPAKPADDDSKAIVALVKGTHA